MQRISVHTALLIAAACAAPAAAAPTVILSTIQGSATSEVPGQPGVRWNELGSRVWRSPSGNYWTFSATTDLPFGDPNFSWHILGSGTSYDLFLPVGVDVPFAPGEARAFGDFNSRPNDAGEVAVVVNTTGPSAADEYLIRYDSVADTYDVLGQQGSPVPYAPGQTWGGSFNDPHILQDGTVAGRNSALGGAPAGQNRSLFIGAVEVARRDVTVPTGQLGGGVERLNNVTDFHVNADGSSYLVKGTLTGDSATDEFVAVDNAVVAQEGATLGGYASPVEDIFRTFMTSSGDHYIRGNNADGLRWITRNGAVVAQTGDTVPGTSETYQEGTFPFNATTFFYSTGNNLGDYVIGGVTSNPDPDLFAVIVLNGSQVVARHSDPVDLDGNGLFDDDAFIRKFIDDAIILTDSLDLYFAAEIRNSAGVDLGDALVHLRVPAPSASVVLLASAAAAMRRRRA